MIKITALLLAVLLSLAIIPTIPVSLTRAQNETDTNATSADNVTSSVNQTITNETTVETNTTIPIGNVTEPPSPPANITLPQEGNETTQPPANVTVPPLEETLPPGNVSQSEPTAIQIQLIPNIQRGHNQHLTLFLIDDVGSVVPDESMEANITNARGNLVGLKSFTTESGTDKPTKSDLIPAHKISPCLHNCQTQT